MPAPLRRVAPALLCAGALGVAGCGNDGVVVNPTPEPGATTPLSKPPATVEPAAAKGRGPVLRGADTPVRSTPPGTLGLGSFATVAHQEYLGSKFADVPLRVSVTSLVVGKAADLQNLPLNADQRAATPYYVHARFQNLSTRSFNAVGIAGGLTVYDAAGSKIPRLDLVSGGFKPCEATGPDAFAPGSRTATCDVFLVPKGKQLGTVRYSDQYGAQYAWAAKP